MSTPHISAKKGDYAPFVIMPGDPLRAKLIAENYLENAVLVNATRNMFGYTGIYKGVPVSVQASGMGCPSMGIYAYELFNVFGVKAIIRTGTVGGLGNEDGSLKLRDIVVAQAACTNSNFLRQYELPGTFAPIADFSLLSKALDVFKSEGISTSSNIHVGNILTSDTFYDDSQSLVRWRKMGVLGVEMETAALYATAARAGKSALSLLTVSDLPLENLSTSAKERESSFLAMLTAALETFVSF